MQIVEPDFTMKPACSSFYDLTFNKRVKKRDTGKYEIEPGPTLYGLTLYRALNIIAHHRTAKKYAEDNISLKQFLTEFKKNYNELIELCRETPPEKFDTGE